MLLAAPAPVICGGPRAQPLPWGRRQKALGAGIKARCGSCGARQKTSRLLPPSGNRCMPWIPGSWGSQLRAAPLSRCACVSYRSCDAARCGLGSVQRRSPAGQGGIFLIDALLRSSHLAVSGFSRGPLLIVEMKRFPGFFLLRLFSTTGTALGRRADSKPDGPSSSFTPHVFVEQLLCAIREQDRCSTCPQRGRK